MGAHDRDGEIAPTRGMSTPNPCHLMWPQKKGNRCLCVQDWVEDFEMRVPRIFQVDPKCHHPCPSKRKAEGR